MRRYLWTSAWMGDCQEYLVLLESGSNFNAAEKGELTVSNPSPILVAVEYPSLVEHLKAVLPLPVETMERCVLENKSVIHSFIHSFIYRWKRIERFQACLFPAVRQSRHKLRFSLDWKINGEKKRDKLTNKKNRGRRKVKFFPFTLSAVLRKFVPLRQLVLWLLVDLHLQTQL